MEDIAKNYKGLQNLLYHNAHHLVGVKETGAFSL
jgi:hypothetical protein